MWLYKPLDEMAEKFEFNFFRGLLVLYHHVQGAMKKPVTITSIRGGQEVSETYESLTACAKHLEITPRVLHRRITTCQEVGEASTLKFAVSSPPQEQKTEPVLWHCDLCDVTIKIRSQRSQISHASSMKHKLRELEQGLGVKQGGIL